jgi:phosphoglycerate dehydrogenase-like enzyme
MQILPLRPHLLTIGKQGVGTDRTDIAACDARGIKVFNTPGVNARAAVELLLSPTMAFARQIRPISLRMKRGENVKNEDCNGVILHQTTIGNG